MDIAVHNQILWKACVLASRRGGLVDDPRKYYPLLVRGSWINDVNQTSVLTGVADPGGTNPALRRLMQGLWKQDRAELMEDMAADPGFREVQGEAERLLRTIPSDALDDFGTYNRLDHLDVLHAGDAAQEVAYALKSPLGRSKTIEEGMYGALDRMHTAAILAPAERFTWSAVSSLGRALHTVHDFYAHTDHIELLLWSLSQPQVPGGLDAGAIGVLMDPVAARRERWDRICPLPPPGRAGAHTPRGAMFWYDEGPGATPLVSTLFDTADTVCSLLEKYSTHLREAGGLSEEDRDGYLDIAMSVLDLSGSRRLAIEAIIGVYEEIEEAVASIGRKVRRSLAGRLDDYAHKLGGAAGDRFATVARLVRRYDAGEAQEWKDAGGYDYVSASIFGDMLDELAARQGIPPVVLPHHAILRKDLPMDRSDHALRYGLACLLSTESTARLLQWYFSPDPTLGKAKALLDERIRHPYAQALSRGEAGNRALCEVIAALRGRDWRNIEPAEGSL